MNSSYDLFGIECNSGWKCLIWPLMRRCKLEGVTVLQVKEKFGGLRFYTGAASEGLSQAISDAEDLSYTICEVCGDPGRERSGGWIKTLCDRHAIR